MRIDILTSLLVVTCLGVVSTSQCEDYLYTPQKAVEGSPVAEDAVRVREVTVKKGDTLSHLSKKYAGRGRYYPQILLFNKIRNPHRIRKGQVLRVPMYSQPAADSTQGAVVQKETAREQLLAVAVQQPQAVISVPPKTELGGSAVVLSSVEKPVIKKKKIGRKERQAYHKAAKAYTGGDCKTAVMLFDRFITRYPDSRLTPEAALNRAECYLKLSATEK